MLPDYLINKENLYINFKCLAIIFIFIFSAFFVRLVDDLNSKSKKDHTFAYRIAIGCVAGISIAALLISSTEGYALDALVGGGLAYFGCSWVDRL